MPAVTAIAATPQPTTRAVAGNGAPPPGRAPEDPRERRGPSRLQGARSVRLVEPNQP